MLRIRVRLLGSLSEYSRGEGVLTFEFAPSIADIIGRLVFELGSSFGEDLFDPVIGSSISRCLIISNGIEIGALDGMETRLTEDGELVIIPVSHGG